MSIYTMSVITHAKGPSQYSVVLINATFANAIMASFPFNQLQKIAPGALEVYSDTISFLNANGESTLEAVINPAPKQSTIDGQLGTGAPESVPLTAKFFCDGLPIGSVTLPAGEDTQTFTIPL